MTYVTNEQRIEVIRRLLDNRPVGTEKLIAMLDRIVEGNLCYIVTLSKRVGYVEVFNASSADEAKELAAHHGYAVSDAFFEADWPYVKGRRAVGTITI